MITHRRGVVLDVQVPESIDIRASDIGVPLVVRDLEKSRQGRLGIIGIANTETTIFTDLSRPSSPFVTGVKLCRIVEWSRHTGAQDIFCLEEVRQESLPSPEPRAECAPS